MHMTYRRWVFGFQPQGSKGPREWIFAGAFRTVKMRQVRYLKTS
jgi:hypothetical protein